MKIDQIILKRSGDISYHIGDTHFFHENIIKYCNRPFINVEEMNSYIINQWNSTIDKNDLVYHHGDFALCNDKTIVSNLVQRLNGSIILILGNHDRHGKQWFYDCGFVEVYKNLKIGNYILSHRPQSLDKLTNGLINIHGHVHRNNYNLDKNKYINVSCEVINYKPIWINLKGD